MLKNTLDNLNRQFEKDPSMSAWNPGGSKVIQHSNKQLEGYRKLAKKKYLKLLKDKEFLQKAENKHQNEALVNKKLGLFRRANVYYLKQMYNDSFKTIIKAIEIVKTELEGKEQVESKKANDWRKKLGLDPGKSSLILIR